MHLSKIIDATSLTHDVEQVSGMLSEVVAQVHDLCEFYPQFDTWMTSKVIPEVFTGGRSILVEYREGRLAALAILKDDGLEKKLCCLRVLAGFENTYGLGVRMFEKSFDALGTDRPLLSVAEERLLAFAKVFQYFGFETGPQYLGRYRANKIEYAYNGTLDVPSYLVTPAASTAPTQLAL